MTDRPVSPVAQRSGAERVLALARKRGRLGVHSSDFDRPGQTVDGGKPIRRLASRIDELRNRGHVFESRPRADRTCDYILVRDAEDVAAALAGRRVPPEPTGEPEPRCLFDPAPEPINAALQDWDVA